MQTFKEYALAERNWLTLAVGKVANRASYMKALEVLKPIWDRKEKLGKHGLEYYAAQVARQFRGVDARTLADMLRKAA
jgi:hypothetical protein